MECFIERSLYPAPVPGKGRGMFSQRALAVNMLIEVSPVLVMNTADETFDERSVLRNYVFGWEPTETGARRCLGLGYISLYNHSYQANCRYEKNTGEQTISIYTVRAIAVGEELTINYNGTWDSAAPIWWFETTDE